MQCTSCSIDFEFYPKEKEFYLKNEIVEPKKCFRCRLQQRLAFWPYGIFRKRKCDATGVSMITTFPEESRFPVYKSDYWFKDEWDAPERSIDWERPFFDQLYELQCKTPHVHSLRRNAYNSDYCDDIYECKNCYLCRSMAECEDCYYCYRFLYCKDSMDLTYCYNMERSYESSYSFRGFDVRFSFNTQDCRDSWFLFDCRGCSNCFMCWNLRQKQYCILNKQYSKENYEEELKKYNLKSRKKLEEFYTYFYSKICEEAIHKVNFNVNDLNSNGDFLNNCKECKDSFFLEDSEDTYYAFRGLKEKDCYDTVGLYDGELTYNTCQVAALYGCKVAVYCDNCKNCEYIDQCWNCHDCFGCVGLKNRRYCIFNKQYKEDEYKELVVRLRKKMIEGGIYGDFFPLKFAYQGYNMSLAPFYFPLKQEEIQEIGALYEEVRELGKEGFFVNELSDDAEDVDEGYMNKPILSSTGNERWSLIKQEIDFYKKMKLPYPLLAPEERNKRRFLQFPKIFMHERDCIKCGKQIATTYESSANGGPKKVYCRECYLKEVY